MKEFVVNIPEEKFSVINFTQDNKPGVALVNTALRGFEPKEVFAWHLSMMLDFQDLIENGMPSVKERKIVDPFCDNLDNSIKGSDSKKPNALFLARITWNATRELIWRVHDPELANSLLQKIIEDENNIREFDYKMENDKEWKLTDWHLNP